MNIHSLRCFRNQLDGPPVIEVSPYHKFAMGFALTSISRTSPEYPWVSVISLYLPLSCNDGSWFLMYKFLFLNLDQVVASVSSIHSSDFPHVFGDGAHPQNSLV